MDDALVRRQCKAAWDVEQDVAVDESRLRLASRFCAFVTVMMSKPIKRGLTIYFAVFPSGYDVGLGPPRDL